MKNTNGAEKKKKIVSKAEKKEIESKRSEKIKGHYGRTFYYSFLISFIVFGLLTIFIFIYSQDKNFFGFSQRYYDRAVSLMEKGDIPSAQKELEDCLKFDETYTRARALLADLYIRNGNYAEAETVLARSIELSPRDIDSYLEYVKVLALQGKFEDAFSFINGIDSSYMSMKVLEKLPEIPTVSPASGNYDSAIDITITSKEGYRIYYTTDGSAPSYNSDIYDGTPITLSKNSLKLRAVAVSDDGYISNEFSASYSVYNSNTEYKFVDSKVEAIVRLLINKPKGTVYYGDLEGITTFSNVTKETSSVTGQIKSLEDLTAIPNLTSVIIHGENGIGDFGSLKSLTNVKELDLSNCRISSDAMTSISSMTWLESLVLDTNGISDISPLAKLIKLKSLSISDNNVKDVSSLSGLTSLTEINLSKNFIQDVSALSAMSKLKTADLSDNLITSVSALSELAQLKSLDLSGNQISSLEALRRLTSLTSLDVSGNKIYSLSAVSALSSLTNLDISSNSVTSLDSLAGLAKLTTLNVSQNSITGYSVLSETNVKNLTAANTGMTDALLAEISKLSKIQTLDVRNNQIFDVSSLTSLNLLTTLNISGNYPKNLSALTGCRKLNSVTCSNSTVSDSDLYALKNKGITVVTN